ncbi:hypothetical protein GDI2700 [Gluconacetobacter diazotrophicus PA1 5]|uniref:Uncharacterized protein n=1 Tax=Gluconacetobacter diazotrophicus (strain ATCC 49037 / DSM 5601 / CCUG 37298 / CIP 103539 / LMG 7603 / PAl5) TaxID=272568 RepID=A9HPX1_GLUDA|nr:hypothetical protein GDI2700 [Gluconacetobacter diazotrophicus PA1 5]
MENPPNRVDFLLPRNAARETCRFDHLDPVPNVPSVLSQGPEE